MVDRDATGVKLKCRPDQDLVEKARLHTFACTFLWIIQSSQVVWGSVVTVGKVNGHILTPKRLKKLIFTIEIELLVTIILLIYLECYQLILLVLRADQMNYCSCTLFRFWRIEPFWPNYYLHSTTFDPKNDVQ